MINLPENFVKKTFQNDKFENQSFELYHFPKNSKYGEELDLTGYAVWDGATNMADFLNEWVDKHQFNPNYQYNFNFNINKSTQNILELGSGTGYVAISFKTYLENKISKLLNGDKVKYPWNYSANKFINFNILLTDGYVNCVNLIKSNLQLSEINNKQCKDKQLNKSDLNYNFFIKSESNIPQINATTNVLLWGEKNQFNTLYDKKYDMIFGSDLIYDKSQESLIRDLFFTVSNLLKLNTEAKFQMSYTRRSINLDIINSISLEFGLIGSIIEDQCLDIQGERTEVMTNLWEDLIIEYKHNQSNQEYFIN